MEGPAVKTFPSAIVEHGDDTETALTRYEAAMFPRSKAAAEKSARGLEMYFAADAPKGLVHFFKSNGSAERALKRRGSRSFRTAKVRGVFLAVHSDLCIHLGRMGHP